MSLTQICFLILFYSKTLNKIIDSFIQKLNKLELKTNTFYNNRKCLNIERQVLFYSNKSFPKNEVGCISIRKMIFFSNER